MKKFLWIIVVSFLSIGLVTAQDTLYIYKAGVVIKKHSVNDIDSISFAYAPPATGTVTDIDGNLYHWITIGTQKWLVENLKSTKFRTGESISNVTDLSLWSSITFAAWFNYNNSSVYGTKYGRLYNWYAVNDSRNIAPVGCHIPNDAEWQILVNYISTNPGTSLTIGKALAASSGWDGFGTSGAVGNNQEINNSSGFNALPAGYAYNFNTTSGTSFIWLNQYTYWWSTTQNDLSNAWGRSINYSSNGIYTENNYKCRGMSVRCIKD